MATNVGDFRVTGVDKVSKAIRDLAKDFPAAAAVALNEIAEETMTDAKEHTPVRYGILRASGHVSDLATPDRVEATLAFSTSYAIWVHERTELRHAVGEAKFLEHAVQRTAATFRERFAKRMEDILG